MRPHASLLLCFSLLSACASDATKATSSSSAGTSGAASAAPSAPPTGSALARPSAAPAPAFKADPEVVRLVKAIATGCTISNDGYARDCKAGEEEALFAYVRKNKPENYFGTLADLALGEGKSDKALFTVATHEIGFLPSDMGEGWYAKNGTPEAVDRLLQAVAAVEPSRLSRVGPGVSAVVLAAGKRAEFMRFLDARPATDDLRRSAVLYWIKYGGVEALADLDHFASAGDETVRYDAGWSPGVALPGPFGGTPVPDATKQTICDAAKKLLDHEDRSVFHGAAESLSRCKGPYLDAALDALEKRVSGSGPTKGDANSLYHMCWAEGVVGAAPNGTKEQCERALAALEKLAEREGADSDDVFMAVFAARTFARDVPDLKPRARALRDRFKSHKEKRIAEEAKQPIQ
ncbi:MAG: hypothetical protein U0414_39085 [Polyangiaceae bacterium]